MISDPEWWGAFNYKLSMVVIVFTWLCATVAGLWKLSRKYNSIMNAIKSKVSHSEMAICKQEITDFIEKSNKVVKDDIDSDRKENKSDHREISKSLLSRQVQYCFCHKTSFLLCCNPLSIH